MASMCLARAAKPSALKLKVIYKHEMRDSWTAPTNLYSPYKASLPLANEESRENVSCHDK